LTSWAIGHGSPGGRPLRKWCLIASACALLSAASAPTALATPITLGGFDFWASLGVPTFSNPWHLPFGGPGSSTGNSNSNGSPANLAWHPWADIHPVKGWHAPAKPQNVLNQLLASVQPKFHSLTYPHLDLPLAHGSWLAPLQQIHQTQMAMIAHIHQTKMEMIANITALRQQQIEAMMNMLASSWWLPCQPISQPPVIPEPGTATLLGMAALVVGAGGWRRRRRSASP
jgi:hypothetical protein